MIRPAPRLEPPVAVALPPARTRALSRGVIAAFALAILAAYTGTLGRFPLAEPDEARYAEIAREMIALHDWATPHLNYVKYFEKPPLVYWLTAAAYEVFGRSELVTRAVPALFALAGILIAYALGATMYGEWVGAVAAAVLAASPFYFGLSQIVILDMPVSVLMAAALFAFWMADTRPQLRARFVALFYLATALGVLTKGPMAVVLTGATIMLFLATQRRLAALRWLLAPRGVALFVVVTLPWFALVSYRNPEFLSFFIVNQHVQRFLTSHEHEQPLWFFVPIVLGGMLPWSALVLLAPVELRALVARRRRDALRPATVFCLVWAAVIFVFFSLSGSKLATYVLPMFCPLAVLTARFIEQVLRHSETAVFRRLFGCLFIFAALLGLGADLASMVMEVPMARVIVARVWVGAAVLAATGCVGWLALARQRVPLALATLVAGMLALQLTAISARGAAPAYRELGAVIRRQARADDLVINYRHYVQGITYYGEHRVTMVGGRGELEFGSRQGDQREFFWDTDADLLRAWASARHVFLVINRSELEPLLPQLQPRPRQIAAQGKKVLIVNFG